MSSSTSRLFTFLFAALLVPLFVVSTTKSSPAFLAASHPGAGSTFAPEKGKFRVIVGGQEVGTEEFEISPSGGNWLARGTAQLHTAQGDSRVVGILNLTADGTPLRYEWSTQGAAKKASATIDFSGATANIDLRVDGARPFTQTFTFNSPRVAVLDNNLYHQYAILARLYNWSQKGPQTFSVLVPQELTPGDVTVESVGKQEIDGAKLEELRVHTEDLELHLYLDSLKLMRIVAPASNAEIIRQ
jgi:hypothetical protein